MSEEQVWVHHPELDRWSEVAETSLDTWADLGWEYQPDGPPSAKFDEAVLTPVVEIDAAPTTTPDTAKVEDPPEVSIQTPEPPASTTAAS